MVKIQKFYYNSKNHDKEKNPSSKSESFCTNNPMNVSESCHLSNPFIISESG